MPELAKDTVALLSFLLPGFLVAWVYYALTSHDRPNQFERVVQALIFSLFVRCAVSIERLLLEWTSNWIVIGAWSAEAELFASLVSALLLGFGAACLTNNDALHAYLRGKAISRRSAHPSEWCGVLAEYPRFIVLNLRDERRLYGWPEVWPSDPEKGHIFMVLAAWLNDSGAIELPETEGILIDVKDVKFIEFVKEPPGI